MEFDFTPEQYALRDVARELFEKESPPSRLRAIWGGAERGDKLWRAMAEVGLLGLAIPEEHGGMGGDDCDLALVLEEAGRAALPEPLLETAAVAAPLLRDAGTPEQRAQWLPRIASGETIAAVQIGGAPFALDADLAEVLLYETDDELHATDAFGTGPVESEDRARRLFSVLPTLSAGTLMPGGRAAAARAVARGAAATACVLNGVGLCLVDTTVEYVRSREQFGRAVGSFQAVKHPLADAHVGLEAARSAAWYAMFALARGLPDAEPAASVAKVAACDAHALINDAALQAHGGIGFTWEHDLHLWLKRGLALAASFGTAREHRARLARDIFNGS